MTSDSAPDPLLTTDPEIARIVASELARQRDQLEMIASENFTSRAVLEAMGSVLTNKYAEGYPKKRYYGGCEFVDEAEELARGRACTLFGAEHANVQPHSGSTANMIAYLAFLKPGDKLLGLSLSHGGHLTHGHPVNFSGLLFQALHYEVEPGTETIDYDRLREQAVRERPQMIVGGASAYPRFWDYAAMRSIADEIGAVLVFDMAHIAGLVAGGVHPSPVPFCDVVTSTTHKTLRGPRGGLILCREAHAKAIDKLNFPGIQGGPFMHVIAAKAVCLHEAMQEPFRVWARQVVDNAQALAKGLLARGFHLVSGGTDNHLLLVDVTGKGLTGKEMEALLHQVGITVNKNTVPFDQNSPFVTSGVRIGTPALTTRGMGTAEMERIAAIIDGAVTARGDADALARLRRGSEELARAFPLYPGL
ncbi:MAG: serine hydroxymethyltransferase [Candidatus Krumholzibacteriia bacterium]